MIFTILAILALLCIGAMLYGLTEKVESFYAFVAIILVIVSYEIANACGLNLDESNKQLLEKRPYIIAAVNDEHTAIHEQAVEAAIEYNLKVKRGKAMADSPWTNWFTDNIWKDAELIELDFSSVKTIGE